MEKEIYGLLLKDIAIFSGLEQHHLDQIAQRMTWREYSSGEMVFREGDPGEELFVVIKGSVSIFIIDPDGKEVVLTTVGAGSYFGEMSIIDQVSRSAACRVVDDSVFLVLHADDFTTMIKEMPGPSVGIMNRMLSIIVERLMKTGAFITQMVQWGEESRMRAITDPATGLFNRRYLEESLEGLVNRSRTSGETLSLVMFDMDRFSTLNANYGQEFCDGLIVKTAEVFRSVFTAEDILVRYGGDEFIFIFPGADAEKAQFKCDSLCAAIRQMHFPEHGEIRLTCSMGYATLPFNASTADELKEKSDRALYRAKETGRDRAVCAE